MFPLIEKDPLMSTTFFFNKFLGFFLLVWAHSGWLFWFNPYGNGIARRAGMTLHQLKVFETVSRHLSITRASKELHVSQPSVFQQVKFLEESCGIKLYRKVGRRIELTPEGMSFRNDAVDILHKVEGLHEKFGPTAIASQTGSLAIGGSHAISISILLSLLAAFKRAHPLVKVTLRTAISPQIERFILNSEVEIGIITNPSGTPSLQLEPYRQEKLVAFCASGFPLAKKARLTLADLADAPLIIRSGMLTTTRQHLNQLEQKGFKLNILMECESPEAVKVATMKGLGVGFVYRSRVESEIQAGSVKVLKLRGLRMAAGQSVIVYQKHNLLSTNAQHFLQLARRLHRAVS
jgi:DNA-binding transcriptional LysR family regulator